jgi:serine/threonine-protein kinase
MSATTFNLVGQVLSGRYEVVSRLDQGGMAFVYLAVDRNLKTNVVIKVPRVSLPQEDDFVVRFEREVGSLVQLRHPHVCRILDIGRHEGLPFVVLQYLPGGNLNDHREVGAEGSPLPTPSSGLHRWLSPIAEALDYIHRQNYVHRDVKPGNIIFDEHGFPYLSDFGVAKVLAEQNVQSTRQALTEAGKTMGTPQYMAPELMMGQPIDGRIDQYALSVTVFEILSGRYPFDGTTLPAIVLAATMQKTPSLSDLTLGISLEAANAVRKGMARQAGERYPTCGAFAQAVLAGILERPTSPFVAASGRHTTTLSVQGTSARVEQPKIYVCPHCGTNFRLKPSSRARKAKCPSCRQIVDVEPDEFIAQSAPSGPAQSAAQFELPGPGGSQSDSRLKWLGRLAPGWLKRVPFKRKPVTFAICSVVWVLAMCGFIFWMLPRSPAYRAYTNGNGEWEIVGNEIRQTKEGDANCLLVFGDQKWTDYDIHVSAKGAAAVGVAFRVTKDPSGDVFVAGGANNQNHNLHQLNASWHLANAPGKISANKWYEITIKVRGNHCDCFIDDLLTLESDNLFPHGAVGLRTQRWPVSYKDIKVTGPDGKVLFSGLPKMPPKKLDEMPEEKKKKEPEGAL